MTRGLPIALLAVSLLSGCAVAPNAGPPPPAANGGSAAALEVGSADASVGAGAGAGAVLPEPAAVSGAAAALLDQSRSQRDAGDLGGAAATIERALTIDPDQALLWIELGEIRRNQGDTDLAAEMARKALTLTSADSALAARARRLLRN